jgi:hypothetical protein
MGIVVVALAFEVVLIASGLAAGSLSFTSLVIYDALIVSAALLCALRALSQRNERVA